PVQRGGGMGMEKSGLDLHRLLSGRFALAQADMAGMGGGASTGASGPGLLRLPDRPPGMPPAMRGMSGAGSMPRMPIGTAMAPGGASAPRVGSAGKSNGVLYLPLGDIAEVKVANGPPMLRD